MRVGGGLVCWIAVKEEGSLRGYLCTERRKLVFGYENNQSGQAGGSNHLKREPDGWMTSPFPGHIVGTIKDIQLNSVGSDT